ncbi:unnamed protein product [Gulo gulo]|uniref:Uncharacterized protein n=1 Tax=Gulo gulo TaxID=48420 RepID=A0A9X9PYE1_GULGU|nr:unnamed protein product [Gulo gulo]
MLSPGGSPDLEPILKQVPHWQAYQLVTMNLERVSHLGSLKTQLVVN